MVHHPMSCSQESRYLHSGSSNAIDFAEGVRLLLLVCFVFFLSPFLFLFSAAAGECYSIIKVLYLMTVLSPRRLNDTPLSSSSRTPPTRLWALWAADSNVYERCVSACLPSCLAPGDRRNDGPLAARLNGATTSSWEPDCWVPLDLFWPQLLLILLFSEHMHHIWRYFLLWRSVFSCFYVLMRSDFSSGQTFTSAPTGGIIWLVTSSS